MTTYTIKVTDGDFVINEATGRPVEITGTEKLRQDVRDTISMAALSELIGQPRDQFAIRGAIMERVSNAFENYREAQATYQTSDRDTTEIFDNITALYVVPMRTSDQTLSNTDYAYKVEISSRARESLLHTGVIVL